MSYCMACGGVLEKRVPPDDDRPRQVCRDCQTIYYRNPKTVVATIVSRDDELLLCRRAITPREGFWTVPGGYLELGESARDGAIRETLEESGYQVEVVAPFAHIDILYIGQVYLFYRAQVLTQRHEPGPETSEQAFFTREAVPWDSLAFEVVREVLGLWFNDHESGQWSMHQASLVRRQQDGPAWSPCMLSDYQALPFG